MQVPWWTLYIIVRCVERKDFPRKKKLDEISHDLASTTITGGYECGMLSATTFCTMHANFVALWRGPDPVTDTNQLQNLQLGGRTACKQAH